jgi:hypothetical protein
MSYSILNHKRYTLFVSTNFGRAQVGYLRGYSLSIKIGIANVLR